MPDQIGRLEGNFSRWVAVDSGYSIINGRIMDSSQAAYLGGEDSFIAPDAD